MENLRRDAFTEWYESSLRSGIGDGLWVGALRRNAPLVPDLRAVRTRDEDCCLERILLTNHIRP